MRSALGLAALGSALLLVAGTFDAEPLYVTGSALVLLSLGALLWIRVGARGASIHRELGQRSVAEGEPLHVTVEARAGRLPLPPGWVEEPLVRDPVRIPGGRRRARYAVDVSFPRRGRRELAPPALVLRDPLGLVEHRVLGRSHDEILVLPRVHPVQTAGGGGEGGRHGSRLQLAAAAEVEIDGLRPYREGAPASRIHWATVARGRGMMERRMVAEADSRPLVVLDPRSPVSDEALDAAVRAAASLTIHFAGQAGCALLLPGDRRAVAIEPDLGAWGPAHVRLALLDDRLGPALAAAGNRRGVVVYVAARPMDRPPRALPRTPGGCILVHPGDAGSRRAVFTVAGCAGYIADRPGSSAAAAAGAAVGSTG